MTMERSLLQMVDFRQQPETTHLVFPPSGDRAPVAIDTWNVDDYEFRGFVNGVLAPVVAMPSDAGWVIYSRRLTKILSTEEALREGITHRLAMRAVEKDLLKNEPVEGQPRMAYVIPGDLVEGLVEEPVKPTTNPPTGQYL